MWSVCLPHALLLGTLGLGLVLAPTRWLQQGTLSRGPCDCCHQLPVHYLFQEGMKESNTHARQTHLPVIMHSRAAAGASMPRVGEIKRRMSDRVWGVEKPEAASPPSSPVLAWAYEGGLLHPSQVCQNFDLR